MNFYQHQDRARKQTRVLVLLFMIAVTILIALTNGVVAVSIFGAEIFGLISSDNPTSKPLVLFSTERWFYISVGVVSVIGAASYLKHRQLLAGGHIVAEQLGGVHIQTNTAHADEKQLLNIVEEMAIAASVPPPSVYLLIEETSINAFAAGHHINDAAIGITQGALDRLNRDQIQAIIAHEFSHIINGDTLLNTRLVSVIAGIELISHSGEFLLHGERRHSRSWRQKNSGFALGLALVVIGYLGRLFSQLIKSAINRQREYLADASAVQFTRNPGAIADALRAIGGNMREARISHHRAEEYSHLFIGSPRQQFFAWFASHPPLAVRIKRVLPKWDGQLLDTEARAQKAQRARYLEANPPPKAKHLDPLEFAEQVSVTHAAVLGGAISSDLLNRPDITESKPEPAAKLVTQASSDKALSELRALSHEPFDATAILLACLLQTVSSQADNTIKKQQLNYIEQLEMKGLAVASAQYQLLTQDLLARDRFILVELCIQSLRALSLAQYKSFRRVVLLCMRADKHVCIFEWSLFALCRHYLEPALGLSKPQRAKYKSFKAIKPACEQLLSCAVHYCHEEPTLATQHFQQGADALELKNLQLLPAQQCTLDTLRDTISTVSRLYPLKKPQLLKAVMAALNDQVSDKNISLLLTIAALIDCPAPILKGDGGI